MSLTKEQIDWIQNFTQQAVLQDDFLEIEATRQMHLEQLRKRIAEFRDKFRKAFELTVRNESKRIGKLLVEDGTQLDEVDMADYIASNQRTSPEVTELAHQASQFIATQTEYLKSITVMRVKAPGDIEKTACELFTKKDIANELYSPLVRERLMPETLVGNMYSETQEMIDRTNELLLEGTATKKEAGQLTPKFERGKELLKLGGGLVTTASGFIGDTGGMMGMTKAQVELVTNLLDGVKMGVDIGDNLYDLLKNSGFPGAADALIDNIGNLLGHVVGMLVDKELAEQISSGYKAVAGGTKAAYYFADGKPEQALQCLASSLESAVAAGDPDGKVKGLATGAKSAALFLQNAGSGIDIGKKIKDGDTAGVINELTSALKKNFSQSFAIVGSTIEGKEEREKFDKSSSETLKDINQGIDWGNVAVTTCVNVYDAAKQKDIAGGMATVLNAIAGQLTSILNKAGVEDGKAGVIGNSVSAGVQIPQLLAHLIQDPPNTTAALKCLGTGVEKALESAAPNNKDLQNVGKAMNHLLQAGGAGIDLKVAFSKSPVDVKSMVAAFEGAALNMGKVALDFAPGEGTTDDAVPDELKSIDFSKAFTESLQTLDELDEEAIKQSQLKQQEEEALSNAQSGSSTKEMIRLLEQSSHGTLSQSDAAKIDTLIAKMIKDRMIMDMALKIAEGGMSVAAKFVPALGAAVNAIKLAANIIAAAERAQALHEWRASTKDFEMAQNMLAAASQNFVRNQAEQFAYYTIQAAFEAAQMIGEILGCTGIASAAGKGLSAAAGAAKSCQDLVRDYARKEDLETAWRKTCKAFNNPNNRKLALEARSMNPTLAKYCIAWGAYEKKDPLARNAVRKIGLNESSLEHEDSDVHKVVQYMEVYFRDDLSLYREIEMDGDWLPADINVTLQCWGAIKSRAVKTVKLTNPDTPRIDFLLDKAEDTRQLLGATDLTDIASLANVVGAFSGSQSSLPDPGDLTVDVDTATRLVDVLEELQSEFYKYAPECTPTGVKVIKSATKVLSTQCRDLANNLRERIEKAAQREKEELLV